MKEKRYEGSNLRNVVKHFLSYKKAVPTSSERLFYAQNDKNTEGGLFKISYLRKSQNQVKREMPNIYQYQNKW